MEKFLSKLNYKKISLGSDFFLGIAIFKKQPDDEDTEDSEAEKAPM